MATTSTLPENIQSPSPLTPGSGLLVSLCPLPADALDETLANLALAFPDQVIDIATPDPAPPNLPGGNLRIASYTPATPAPGAWVLTAADYLNTYKLVKERNATSCLLLGAEAQSLAPESLRALAEAAAAGHSDLVTPQYALGAREGLVNSAILYPATRALFGTRPRYPLAIDLAFSARMVERLATAAQRLTAANQNAALIWPVAEAASAGFTIGEVSVGSRIIPAPDAADLNSLLTQVAGSFFADIDAKASYWQRARLAYPQRPRTTTATAEAASTKATSTDPAEAPDIQPMLDSFRLAYTNLHEIWSLVLPPNSLLGLKKLSIMPPAAFLMPDSLWARIVYDFILAYRLRTINRGHLLGALTPLYLAWVASHLLLTGGSSAETTTPEKHVEAVAAAFEADKPYLVARWRWPDRFNP
jgi:glucosylglycerate synthase